MEAESLTSPLHPPLWSYPPDIDKRQRALTRIAQRPILGIRATHQRQYHLLKMYPLRVFAEDTEHKRKVERNETNGSGTPEKAETRAEELKADKQELGERLAEVHKMLSAEQEKTRLLMLPDSEHGTKRKKHGS